MEKGVLGNEFGCSGDVGLVLGRVNSRRHPSKKKNARVSPLFDVGEGSHPITTQKAKCVRQVL